MSTSVGSQECDGSIRCRRNMTSFATQPKSTFRAETSGGAPTTRRSRANNWAAGYPLRNRRSALTSSEISRVDAFGQHRSAQRFGFAEIGRVEVVAVVSDSYPDAVVFSGVHPQVPGRTGATNPDRPRPRPGRCSVAEMTRSPRTNRSIATSHPCRRMRRGGTPRRRAGRTLSQGRKAGRSRTRT